MTEPESSLQALQRGRDAVAAAASKQARTLKPSLEELHAFGSAIVSTIAQLGHLSSTLADQVGRFDEAELERAKVSDDPADKLKVAGTHLSQLNEELAEAATNAHRYWTAMEAVELHTASDRKGNTSN